jgi:hypothetical protein
MGGRMSDGIVHGAGSTRNRCFEYGGNRLHVMRVRMGSVQCRSFRAVLLLITGVSLLASLWAVEVQAQTPPAAPQNVRIYNGTATVPPVTISVSPATVTLAPGATVQFTATVSGTTNTAVSWTATGGTVTQTGTYTAGPNTGSYFVKATLSNGTISATAPVTSSTNPGPIIIYPGEDILAKVNAAPAGAAFVLKAGVHHPTGSITPKDGQQFSGEPGTILSGARSLTGWIQDGSRWYLTGQTQQGIINGSDSSVCVAGHPRCAYPEDLFINDGIKLHVATQAEVGPGKWFFDYAADRIYIGDNPAGARVETSITPLAFGGSAGGVTIRNLIIEKYANPSQNGVIRGGANWTVDSNEVRWNHGIGIHMGPSRKVLNNKVHHQGQMGIGGSGNGSLVEGNEIAYNNVAGYNPYWEAGATKFTFTDGLIIRNNFVHHNAGPGLWCDIDNINIVYEGNTVEDNEQTGIGHEISYDAIIRNNIVRRNGTVKPYPYWVEGAGITVSSSKNVEVYGNLVEDNWQGIMSVQQDRGSGSRGLYILENLYMHDNTIKSVTPLSAGSGRSGLAQLSSWSGANSYTSLNNRFEHNTYYLGTYATYFLWNFAELNETQWKGYKQDLTGTFVR